MIDTIPLGSETSLILDCTPFASNEWFAEASIRRLVHQFICDFLMKTLHLSGEVAVTDSYQFQCKLIQCF